MILRIKDENDMKKMRFYILFSEELNKPFTNFKEFADKRTFSLMEDGEYGDYLNLKKMTLFVSIENAQKEKENMLEYMNSDTKHSMNSSTYQSYYFKDDDFNIIKNLKIVEFRSCE